MYSTANFNCIIKGRKWQIFFIIDEMLLSMLEIDECALDSVINKAWEEYGFEKLIECIFFPFYIKLTFQISIPLL